MTRDLVGDLHEYTIQFVKCVIYLKKKKGILGKKNEEDDMKKGER